MYTKFLIKTITYFNEDIYIIDFMNMNMNKPLSKSKYVTIMHNIKK